MISDALSEAVQQIDEYLAMGWYDDSLDLPEIKQVRDAMDNIRRKMDTPPDLRFDPYLVGFNQQ